MLNEPTRRQGFLLYLGAWVSKQNKKYHSYLEVTEEEATSGELTTTLPVFESLQVRAKAAMNFTKPLSPACSAGGIIKIEFVQGEELRFNDANGKFIRHLADSKLSAGLQAEHNASEARQREKKMSEEERNKNTFRKELEVIRETYKQLTPDKQTLLLALVIREIMR